MRYPQSFRDNYLPPLTCRQFRVQIGDWILTHQFENLAGITPTETEIFQFELQGMLNLYLPYNSETMTHDVWLQQVIPRFKQSEEDVRSGAVWLNTSFLMKSLQAILYNGFVDNAERFWFSTVDTENFSENYRATGLVRTHLMGMSILIVGDFELSEMTIRNLTSHYDALIVFTNQKIILQHGSARSDFEIIHQYILICKIFYIELLVHVKDLAMDSIFRR